MTSILSHEHRASVDWQTLADEMGAETIPLLRMLAVRTIDRSSIAADATVLNVDAGTGTLALLLAEKAARVVCTETWPSDRERLEKRLLSEGMSRVQLAETAGEALPFPDRVFDGVFWTCPLWLKIDRTAIIDEMVRVLKAGCRLNLILWDFPEPIAEPAADPLWLIESLPQLAEIEMHHEQFALTAPSEAALMFAMDAPTLARATPRRSNYSRMHLIGAAIEAAERTTGPIELSLDAYTIHACVR
jgi:SAM-dependent methyltransferase